MANVTPNDGSPPIDGPNARQVQYWNSPATAPWVTLQDRLDALFAPLARAALDLAQPSPGEHVLDAGCGCGATVLELARRVGVTGHVTGVDISAPMLARARSRVNEEGLSQVTLTLADAATHDFAPKTLDLVFSRLGIMFFADPAAAFVNLRAALKPTGRLVFACIRTPAENPFTMTAVQAARPLLPPDALPAAGPEEPGMFSFADPARARRILEAAGFHDIVLTPHDLAMRLAGPGGAAEAAAFSVQFGPLPRALVDVGADIGQAIIEAVTETYRRLETPDGIVLGASFWIVTAGP
ncbi:MAG TPA: class I SAM-dependent methyltransferase [Stellaceae bacterium]|nr:class I SAM-dependent methyltransferase [Stellaceae bacterium]